MTLEEADAILGILDAAFPNQSLEEDTNRVWLRALQQFKYEPIMRTVEEVILTATFWPSIGEVTGPTYGKWKDAQRNARFGHHVIGVTMETFDPLVPVKYESLAR